jgi:hypothetical protein
MGCKVSKSSIIKKYSDEKLSDIDIFLSLCISHDANTLKKVIKNVYLEDHYGQFPLIYHAVLYILSCDDKKDFEKLFELLCQYSNSSLVKTELYSRYIKI